MSNHTPGPWRLTHNEPSWGRSYKYVIYANSPYKVSQANESIEMNIGSIDMNDHYGHRWQLPVDEIGDIIKDASFNVSEINAKANAKLIASAPELLEACIEMISAFGNAPASWLPTKDVQDAEILMNEAIRKATE